MNQKLVFNTTAKQLLQEENNGHCQPDTGGIHQIDANHWEAFDTTNGELFIEVFASPLEAIVYAFGYPALFPDYHYSN